MIKKISGVLGLFLMVTVVWGVVSNGFGYYAKAEVVDKAIATMSADIQANKVEIEKEKIKKRMMFLEERMWTTEDRWTEKFIVQYNRIPDSLSELLHFMTPEAKDLYRQDEKEYRELDEKLKNLDDDD